MAISLDDMKDKLHLSPDRQARINARAKQLVEDELTLRDLRRGQHLTQERVAELLGVEQDSI